MSYVRQSFDLMKETRKLPLAFSIETVNPKHEEQLGQLMCIPEEVGSRLSEMIHFEAKLVAAHPR